MGLGTGLVKVQSHVPRMQLRATSLQAAKLHGLPCMCGETVSGFQKGVARGVCKAGTLISATSYFSRALLSHNSYKFPAVPTVF